MPTRARRLRAGLKRLRAPKGYQLVTAADRRAELTRWWWAWNRSSFLAWLRGPTFSIPKPVLRAYRASGHGFCGSYK